MCIYICVCMYAYLYVCSMCMLCISCAITMTYIIIGIWLAANCDVRNRPKENGSNLIPESASPKHLHIWAGNLDIILGKIRMRHFGLFLLSLPKPRPKVPVSPLILSCWTSSPPLEPYNHHKSVMISHEFTLNIWKSTSGWAALTRSLALRFQSWRPRVDEVAFSSKELRTKGHASGWQSSERRHRRCGREHAALPRFSSVRSSVVVPMSVGT